MKTRTIIGRLPVIMIALLATVAASAADTDRFSATETIRPAAPELPANAKVVKLRLGETLEVFSYQRTSLLTDKEEEVFFLPPEATRVLQLVVEKKGRRRVYFVKAHNIGQTVGGVVKRRWLDAEGFRPRDAADEGRVQEAVKKAPVVFVVEHPPVPVVASPKN